MSLLPGGSLLLGQPVQVLHHYHNCFLAASQDSLVVAACFLDYQLDTRTRRTFAQHKSVGVDRSHVKRLHLKYVACWMRPVDWWVSTKIAGCACITNGITSEGWP